MADTVDVNLIWSSGLGEYAGDQGETFETLTLNELWFLLTEGRRQADLDGNSGYVSTVTIDPPCPEFEPCDECNGSRWPVAQHETHCSLYAEVPTA